MKSNIRIFTLLTYITLSTDFVSDNEGPDQPAIIHRLIRAWLPQITYGPFSCITHHIIALDNRFIQIYTPGEKIPTHTKLRCNLKVFSFLNSSKFRWKRYWVTKNNKTRLKSYVLMAVLHKNQSLESSNMKALASIGLKYLLTCINDIYCSKSIPSVPCIAVASPDDSLLMLHPYCQALDFQK